MKIFVGRDRQGVDSCWNSRDGKFAVVKTFHDPPQYVVMGGGYGGWLLQSSHKTAKAAVAQAKKLSGES